MMNGKNRWIQSFRHPQVKRLFWNLLKQLRKNKQLLEFFRICAAEKKDRKHQIWQEALAKNVFSEKFLFEKMEYIHSNAVYKRWRLVENRPDYPYSSSCYYDRGEEPIIPIDDIRKYLIPNGESGEDASACDRRYRGVDATY